jgi:bis(5'-nucleosyl)-tetraphosphatase (symmetrical)
MATYAIGDIHGSYQPLQRLLARLGFDRRADRLWLVGDLVNRGPQSLEVLRWAVDLDDRDDQLTAVLGNHDLHLLALAAGVSPPRRRDTFEALLAAPDRDDLLAWLRRRPLFVREGDFALVHAGLFPAWTLDEAEALARQVEETLRGPQGEELLAAVSARSPERWRPGLTRAESDRAALAGFAKMRTLTRDESLCAEWSGAPEESPKECTPWFDFSERRSRGATVVFGHWAAAGLRLGPGFAALDTGCAWGGALTALRLDDWAIFQEPA